MVCCAEVNPHAIAGQTIVVVKLTFIQTANENKTEIS
jgi:hypothetical protein